jgi:glycosyltransferase involved in cell wall biosynthesis
MPLISIITPVYQPVLAHLSETVRCVAEQKLPSNWSVEWIVQEDASDRTVDEAVLSYDSVRYQANGSHLGPAATRNIALARARGELVQVLDQDDYLLPDALNTLIPHFNNPSIHWATGQQDDLHEDGTRTTRASRLPFGPLAPGLVNSAAINRGGNWAVHCAGLMLRTEIIRALGGWVASWGWGDDDIVMFAGLSEITHGYNDPTVTWLYRQHPGQLTRTAEIKRFSALGRQVALQRIIAMRSAEVQITTARLHRQATPVAGPAEKG